MWCPNPPCLERFAHFLLVVCKPVLHDEQIAIACLCPRAENLFVRIHIIILGSINQNISLPTLCINELLEAEASHFALFKNRKEFFASLVKFLKSKQLIFEFLETSLFSFIGFILDHAASLHNSFELLICLLHSDRCMIAFNILLIWQSTFTVNG